MFKAIKCERGAYYIASPSEKTAVFSTAIPDAEYDEFGRVIVHSGFEDELTVVSTGIPGVGYEEYGDANAECELADDEALLVPGIKP
ncbi:MAG: hypothetical protein AB7F64_10230 [Gammaproteobacteria bacterium]